MRLGKIDPLVPRLVPLVEIEELSVSTREQLACLRGEDNASALTPQRIQFSILAFYFRKRIREVDKVVNDENIISLADLELITPCNRRLDLVNVRDYWELVIHGFIIAETAPLSRAPFYQ